MFTEDLWQAWSTQEERNYSSDGAKKKFEKKGYTHFDHRFWFPERKDELKHILENRLTIKKPDGNSGYWSFSPFLKVLVKTPRYKYQEFENSHDLETKIRPICFASHIDGLIFGFYSFALTKVYERYILTNSFDDCILAYRSDLGSSNIQFSKEVFEHIRNKKGPCTAIALDIKGYFDHIDHVLLKEKWIKILGERKLPEDQYRIYKVLTNYSYVNKSSIYKKFRHDAKRSDRQPRTLLDLIPGGKNFEKYDQLRSERIIVTNDKPDKKTGRYKGVPQGSAMSALLSNIYLIDFDKMMADKARKEGFMYRRYCDDILIICDTEKANELQDFAITHILSDYHLTIQKKKVEIIDFRRNSDGKVRAFKRKKKDDQRPVATNVANEKLFYKPLQYLGFEFNGQDILIRSSSLSRYFRKMRARVVKTISMSYSNKSKSHIVFKKQILERYTHFGKRNFLSYAYKASSEKYENSEGDWKIGMNSPAIRKQVGRHFAILMNSLEKKNEQRFQYKLNKKGQATRKKIH